MAPESNAVEQAVARALRDNLERIQRTSDELQQSINDIVAACSSSKPTNALPPMLRAQTAAASLAAALEVLTRFTAMAMQPGPRSPLEEKITEAINRVAPEASAPPAPPAPSAPATRTPSRPPPRRLRLLLGSNRFPSLTSKPSSTSPTSAPFPRPISTSTS